MTSICETDTFLKHWIESVSGVQSVSFNNAVMIDSQKGVNVCLYRISKPQIPDSNIDTPLQLCIYYLITVCSDTPDEEHQILTDLAFAALQSNDFDVTFPEQAFFSEAFGIPIHAGMIISFTIMKKRTLPPIKIVQKPLVIKQAFQRPLNGLVIQDDKPSSNLKVSIPSINISALTSASGTFELSAIPAECIISELPKQLELTTVKGKLQKIKNVQIEDTSNSIFLKITLEV